jgi:BirA family transcriptional regulator, biotin operon repressor / biotin---[acetyl-CoA-carboxylase] ligase
LKELQRPQLPHLSDRFPSEYDKLVLAEVDSTNAHAVRVVNDLYRPTWILGLKQIAGRGRRGRKWINSEGNFAATLVLFAQETAETLALRSFVASLALFEALVMVTGRSDLFSLKWPNDVLLNGGKMAGILLETLSPGADQKALSIGVGVNLIVAPDIAQVEANATPPVSLFAATGAQISPEQFLNYFASCYATRETEFVQNGFQPIRQAWLGHAARLGEGLTARLPNREISGRFDTIDEKGHLVLKTAQGNEVIAAADVFF